jgi:hypothetical protein
MKHLYLATAFIELNEEKITTIKRLPFTMRHDASVEHWFVEAWQNKPFDVEQSEVPQVHAFALTAKPSVLAQPTFPHLLVLPQQYFPVLVSHLDVPHWHALAFSTLPSTLVQLGWLEQRLLDFKQYKPLDKVQSLVPHEQAAEFARVPLMTGHGASMAELSQRFVADRQYRPVEDEQVAVPHKQSTELFCWPFVTLHTARTQILNPLPPVPPSLFHLNVSPGFNAT